MGTTEVVVGRVGKPHGVRGEVSVELRTDEPDRRFADGAVLGTRLPRGGAPHGADRPARLTVAGTRWHQSRLLVTFDGVADRTAAEALRGLTLVVDVDLGEQPDDPDEFYDHQLVGLAVVTTDGDAVGELSEVIHGAGQDLHRGAHPRRPRGAGAVRRGLVPVVDVAAGRVEVADRPGLITPLEE